jgi:hypothetical protein
MSECARCHRTPLPGDSDILLCRCVEAAIWEENDKHKIALKNLGGERGRQIVTLLKYAPQDIDKNCVSCHGVYVQDPKLKHASFRRPDDAVNNGVTCAVCHGPYREWVDKHGGLDREEWRKLSRSEKETKFGMTDLWDPAKRTKLCASCHIGETASNRVVTHAMYAAGHPPLPGIEVGTFSDAMPRHWQYLREKNSSVQKLLNFNPTEREQAKLVLVGAAVELREAMNLLASQAEECRQAKGSESKTLDLAQFDCYACHHELKVPSWRQKRGYLGRPGRPQFRAWPLALIKVGIRHAGKNNGFAEKMNLELEERLQKLRFAFDLRPFGEPEQVAAAARELAVWSDKLGAELNSAAYQQSSVPGILKQICTVAGSEILDYDGARQVAWAFQIIYDNDLNPKPVNDAKIRDTLKELSEELKLRLPAGQKNEIETELSKALSRISAYDPASFQKKFKTLSLMVVAYP